MLTRDDIMTLQKAAKRFGLDHTTRAILQEQLEPVALRHLGWQDDGGWFYPIDAIIQELEQIAMCAPRPRSRVPKDDDDRVEIPPEYCTSQEAAELLGISKQRLAQLIEKERFEVLRVPRGITQTRIYVLRSSIEAELARRAAHLADPGHEHDRERFAASRRRPVQRKEKPAESPDGDDLVRLWFL
jgi:hypothetical protein